MKTRLLAVLNVSLLATAISLGLAPSKSFGFPDTKSGTPDTKSPPPAAAADTEDVIYMNDGRELHGQIISETKTQVVFDYKDPRLSIKTKLTLAVDDILHIDRKMAIAANQKPADTSGSTTGDSSKANQPAAANGANKSGVSDVQRNYGTSRVQSNRPNVPSFYIVPVKGQFGTDIIASVYKDVVKDIREHKPDVIIFDVSCSDTSELMHPEGFDIPDVEDEQGLMKWRHREDGLLDFEDYREFVHIFRDELRDIDQVVWVHDADGVSANIMMAWDKMFMTPSARLGGLITVLAQSGARNWQDSDIRAKMTAAWLGIAKSFLEKGHYAPELADAMLDPEVTLSGHWEGREMKWSLDTNGAYVVDGSNNHTANFRAKSAEDLCISKGTAEDLDELALLLGYREYHLVDGKQFEYTTDYVERWRREYKNTHDWWIDYRQHLGWANGAEQAKWLGKAKQDIEKIIRAMDQYKAIETRWKRDVGVSKLALIALDEKLTETLAGIKNRNKGNGGGPGGGGGGKVGGAGGGRGSPG